MTQSQQLRKLAARSATAFLLAALCVFPLYIDKFSNLGVVKFTGICTLSWAFALWRGARACVGARPDPGRLPWKADPALWALGAVTASGVVSTVLSRSPGASFWGLGGYYGGGNGGTPMITRNGHGNLLGASGGGATTVAIGLMGSGRLAEYGNTTTEAQ